MRVIKKILTAVGILGLLFIGLLIIAGDDDTTTPTEPGTESGTSVDNEGYYTLVLEDGSSVDILKPETILNGQYKNLNEQREESIFTSIYNYDHIDEEGVEVYITYIPDAELTLKEMLREPYAPGTIFHFDMKVTGGPADGVVSGDVEGDDSVSNLLHIDTSYIGDEKYELMFDDMVSFDAVYAGLDIYSTPTFIGMSMQVQ